jgi:hypothetical protein
LVSIETVRFKSFLALSRSSDDTARDAMKMRPLGTCMCTRTRTRLAHADEHESRVTSHEYEYEYVNEQG